MLTGDQGRRERGCTTKQTVVDEQQQSGLVMQILDPDCSNKRKQRTKIIFSWQVDQKVQ